MVRAVSSLLWCICICYCVTPVYSSSRRRRKTLSSKSLSSSRTPDWNRLDDSEAWDPFKLDYVSMPDLWEKAQLQTSTEEGTLSNLLCVNVGALLEFTPWAAYFALASLIKGISSLALAGLFALPTALIAENNKDDPNGCLQALMFALGAICAGFAALTACFCLFLVLLLLWLIVMLVLAVLFVVLIVACSLILAGGWLAVLMCCALFLWVVLTFSDSLMTGGSTASHMPCGGAFLMVPSTICNYLLNLLGQATLFFIELCLMAESLNTYGLLPACTSKEELCESHRLVTSWIATPLRLEEIPFMLDLLWLFEGIVSFALSIKDMVPEMGLECGGRTLTILIILGGSICALMGLQTFKIHCKLAKSLAIVNTKGYVFLGLLISGVQACFMKLIEFKLAIGSSAFAMVVPQSGTCDYHGDSLLHWLTQVLLWIVVLGCIVSTPSIVMYALGAEEAPAAGTESSDLIQKRQFRNPCLAVITTVGAALGCWHVEEKVMQDEIDKAKLTTDPEKEEFVVRYIAVIKDILAATLLMFPFGAMVSTLTKRANQGNVLFVDCNPPHSTSIRGFVEKGIAVSRWFLMVAIMFEIGDSARNVLLLLCISLISIETGCALRSGGGALGEIPSVVTDAA